MKITELMRGRKEYISVCIMPLKYNENGNTIKTGKQASFQIRNKGAKDVLKIKEILQFLITHKGVMAIYKELKRKKYAWVGEDDI